MKRIPALVAQLVAPDANQSTAGSRDFPGVGSSPSQEPTQPLQPPPLPFNPRRGDRWLLLWWLGGALAVVVGLRLAGLWQIPLPKCWLRTFTGVPCPSCGCTRSLLAWSHFDLAQAFSFNPLFFICCVAGLLWLTLWAAERFLQRPWLGQWRARVDRWPVGAIFIGLVALNWLYLCLRLPK